MKNFILSFTLLLPLLGIANAQSNEDTCHAYIVDVARASRALADFRESGDAEADARALSVGQTVFPEFHPVRGEEQLTTKHYSFPNSRLFITASVYYTDESMASLSGEDSMLLGIAVASRRLPDALSASVTNSAIVEVTNNQHTDTVRAKQYVRVNGRLYLIGLECRRRGRRLN